MKKLSQEEMKEIIGGNVSADMLNCAQHHQACDPTGPFACCNPQHLCEDWGGTGPLGGQICRTIYE